MMLEAELLGPGINKKANNQANWKGYIDQIVYLFDIVFN
jgi:hypothetical protein